MRYIVSHSFICRTPLLPFDVLMGKKINAEQVFDEALYIASPELWQEIQDGTIGDRQKLAETLYKYKVRAAARCTPFGVWAGCSLGKVGDYTRVVCLPVNQYRSRTRLDMGFLGKWVDGIVRDKQIQKQLLYYPNDSLYKVGDFYRYTSYTNEGNRRHYQLSQVESSVYLIQVLDKAQCGATLEELSRTLVDEEVSFEEAEAFVLEVTDAGLLQNEWEINVTGREFAERVAGRLEELEGTEEYTGFLKGMLKGMKDIDAMALGRRVPDFQRLQQSVLNTGMKTKFWFQTDLFKPVQEASLSRLLAEDLQHTLEFLYHVMPRLSHGQMDAFRDAFVRRYGEQEVPLTEALDPEFGIGYDRIFDSNSLIDDLVFPEKSRAVSLPFRQLLIKKILAHTGRIISLDEIKVPDDPGSLDLPAVLTAMVSILKDDDTGCCYVLGSASWSSATSALGRFAGLDQEIADYVQEVARKEQSLTKDLIAEVVHVPRGRVVNVTSRPILSEYEICYMAAPGVERHKGLPLADLLVSVRKGKVILRSRRLNRRVIPRISASYNHRASDTTSIYRFLGDLNVYYRPILSPVDGKAIFAGMEHAPRMVYRNCILSPEGWKLRHQGKKEDNISYIAEWRKEKGIERWIYLSEEENRLLIDLEDPIAVKILSDTLAQKGKVWVEEFLFSPENAVVKNEEGSFLNEFVMTFYRK